MGTSCTEDEDVGMVEFVAEHSGRTGKSISKAVFYTRKMQDSACKFGDVD